MKQRLLLFTLLFFICLFSFSAESGNAYTLIQRSTAVKDSIVIQDKFLSSAYLCITMPDVLSSNFNSSLDLEKSILNISYKTPETDFLRESFVDFNSPIFVMRVSSSKKQLLNFTLNYSANSICTIITEGGELIQSNFGYEIKHASSAAIYFSMQAVDAQYSDAISKISNLPYNKVKKLHIAAFEEQTKNYFLRLPKSAKVDMFQFNEARHVKLLRKLSKDLWNGFYVPDDSAPVSFDFDASTDSSIVSKLVDFSNGMIDILPHLPTAWAKSGRIVGIEGPGGFKVSVVWAAGKIKTLVIRSSKGGNCRLRVPHEIDACHCLGLHEAQGLNPNSAFFAESLSIPISTTTQTFDFETYPDQVIVITGK